MGAAKGRKLAVSREGKKPNERRIVPAEGGVELNLVGDRDKAGVSIPGLERPCHRSDVNLGRAKRGAVLIVAYLRGRNRKCEILVIDIVATLILMVSYTVLVVKRLLYYKVYYLIQFKEKSERTYTF